MAVVRLLFGVISFLFGILAHSAASEVSDRVLSADVIRHVRVDTTETLRASYIANLSDSRADTCVRAVGSTDDETHMSIGIVFVGCLDVSRVRVEVKSDDQKELEKVKVEMRKLCGHSSNIQNCSRDGTVSEGFLDYTCGLSCKRVTVLIPIDVTVCRLTVYRQPAILQLCEPMIMDRMLTSLKFQINCSHTVGPPPSSCQGVLYKVSYRLSGSKQKFDIQQVSQLTFELSGLTAYQEYEIRMLAVYKEHCLAIKPMEWSGTIRSGYSPPPRPEDVQIGDVTDTTASVNWKQPQHPQGIKVRNEIRFTDESSMLRDITHGWSTKRSARLNNLVPLTNYAILIIAINDDQLQAGGPEVKNVNMAMSNAIQISTTGSAPTIMVGSVKARSAVVTWDVSKELQSRNVMYIVELFEVGKNNVLIQEDSVTKKTTTLEDLKPYTMYHVEVWAKVDSLMTEKSSETFTTAEAAPSPPQDVRARNVGSRTATVSWSPPHDRNGQLMEYRVRIVPGVSQWKTVSKSTLSYHANGLLPNTFYRAYVVAINNRSRELISEFATTTFTTNTEASSPPQNFSYFNLTFSSVVITWHKPLILHGTVSRYNVSFFVSGHKVRRFSTKKVSQYVDRLKAYTHYRVHVRAGTLMNSSPSKLLWSDPAIVNITTKQTSPSQPRELQAPRSGITSRSLQLQWKKPDPSNGNIQFYRVYLWEKLKPSTSSTITREIPTPDDSLSTNVTRLSPSTAYWVSIAAVNVEDGNELVGEQTSHKDIKVKTLDEAPTKPSNCTILDHNDTTLRVSWMRPHPGDYRVVSYNLTYLELSRMISVSRLVYTIGGWIVGLRPYTEYGIRITAITNNSAVHVGPPCSLTTKTKIGSLPTPNKLQLATNDITHDESSYSIILPDMNVRDVPLHSVEVVVVEIGPTSLWFENVTLPSRKDNRVVDMYVARVMEPDTGDDRVVIGTGIGNDRLLKPSTKYAVYIRFVSFEDDGKKLTSVSLPLILTTNALAKKSSSSSGVAVWVPAVVAIIVSLSLIVVIVMLIVAKRSKTSKSSDECTNEATQESGCAQNGDSTVKKVPVAIQNEEEYESPVYAVATVVSKDNSDGVIKEFEQHVNSLKADYNEGFIDEFESLTDVGTDQSSSFGRNRDNKKKNRYQNIVPYDGKCVMLEELAGMSILETEYINATCIDGFEQDDAYIVAQGPLPATCHDFWRMVWLREPSAIVMLTRTVENGKNKCKQYWLDNDPVQYDGLTIEVESITDLADYTVRLIKMTLLDEERSIKHYHFKSWPDHGVPRYATDLLGLLYRVRRDTRGSPSPLLVHCSAGVGRSGTYVTIDFIVDCLKSKPAQKIDVCKVVTDLRMSRMEMVQSVLQYILIHEAVLEAYFTRNSEMLASEFCKVYARIAALQSGHQSVSEEYDALVQLSPSPDKSAYTSALLPTVLRRKNRTSQFLPPDSVRVMLHVDDDSPDADYVNTEEGADYINASYVNSYSARKAFVVTQAPLPSTMIDMWKMVSEQNVTAIVNLAQNDEHDIYWPESGSSTYGHLKVEMTSVEAKNAFSVYRLHLTKNTTEHDMVLFHYTDWPSNGSPSNVKGLFEMMSELDQWQKRHSGCRVVVHCCTGMGRSGVFCAAYNVLEQVQNEGVVNILYVAKFLCNQRPGIIQTLEHYRSIYSIIDHYLQSDMVYSNVK